MDERTILRSIPNYAPAWPSVTSHSFAETYADAPVAIVHFWAVWNGCDAVMENDLKASASRLPDHTQILACNIDDPNCVALAKDAGVLNIPWLSVYVEGHLHGHICGLRNADSLADELNALIATKPIAASRKWWRFW